MASRTKPLMLVAISLSTILFSVFLFVTYYSSITPLLGNNIGSCNFAQQCESFCPIVFQQTDWTKTLNASMATPQQVIDYFYWANASSCRLSHAFGGKMMKNPSGLDGQKSVCLDPVEVAPKPGNCLVYSFGINDEWSFDDAMEQYGCQIFAFDPSMKLGDHKRSEMIQFYKMGIGIKDHINNAKWKINTLQTIYKNLGHEGKIIDYLKMDIEGGEWDVLAEILKSGMMPKVRQLAVEFHWYKTTPLNGYRFAVALIKSIEDSGLVRFDSKYNPWFKMQIPSLGNYSGPVGFEIAWYQILPA